MIFRIDGGVGGTASLQMPVQPAATAPAAHPAASASSTSAATPAPTPGQLAAGARLAAGQSVRSANGRFELLMQKDGNLVEIDRSNNVVVWASHTNGSGATCAVMQKDGNLVLYRGTPNTTPDGTITLRLRAS